MLELTIKTLDARNHDFSVQPDTTVAQLKEIIAERVQIQPARQRLIYAGKVLQNDIQLSSIDVHQKVIHLVERAPPSELRPQPGRENTPTNRNRPLQNEQQRRAGGGVVFETFNHPSDGDIRLIERGRVVTFTMERLSNARRFLQDISQNLDDLELTTGLAATDSLSVNTPPSTSSSNNNPTKSEANPSSAGQTKVENENCGADAAAGPSVPGCGPECFIDTTDTNTLANEPNRLVAERLRADQLAEIMEEMHGLQNRLLPFHRRYIAHLRDQNNRAEAERGDEQQFYNNQVIAERIRVLMHTFSHLYHTISELEYDFDENLLASEPRPESHMAIPIQTQINVLTSRRPAGAHPEGAAPRPNAAAPPQEGAAHGPAQAATLAAQAVEVTLEELMVGAGGPGAGRGPRPNNWPYHVQIETHVPIAFAVAELRNLPTENQPQQPARQAQAGNEPPSAPTATSGGTAPPGNATPVNADMNAAHPSDAGAYPRPRVTVMPLNFGNGREPMEMMMPEFAGTRTVGGAQPGGWTQEFIQNIIQTVLDRTPAIPGAVRHERHILVPARAAGAGGGHGRPSHTNDGSLPRDTSDVTPPVQSGNSVGPRGPRLPPDLCQELILANRSVREEGRPLRPNSQSFQSYDRFLACASPFRDPQMCGRYPVNGVRRSNGERLHMLRHLITDLDQYTVENYFNLTTLGCSEIPTELLSLLARELTLGDLVRLFLGDWQPLVRLHAPLDNILRRTVNDDMRENHRSHVLQGIAMEIIHLHNDFWSQVPSYIFPNQSNEPASTAMGSTMHFMTVSSLVTMMNLVINNTQPEVFACCLHSMLVRAIEEICTMLYSACTDTYSGADSAIRAFTRIMVENFDPHYQIFLFTLMHSALSDLRTRFVDGRPNHTQGQTAQQDERNGGVSSLTEHDHEDEMGALLRRMLDDDFTGFENSSSSSDNPDCPDTPESPDEENRVPTLRRGPIDHSYPATRVAPDGLVRGVGASLLSHFIRPENETERSPDSSSTDNARVVDSSREENRSSNLGRARGNHSHAATSDRPVSYWSNLLDSPPSFHFSSNDNETGDSSNTMTTDNLQVVDESSLEGGSNNEALPSSSGSTPKNVTPVMEATTDADATHTPIADGATGRTPPARPEPSHSGEAGRGPPANAAVDVAPTTDRPADWSNTVPVEWIPVLTEDERRQWRQAVQPPFSDAYLSGMPARKRKIVQQRKPHSFQQLFQDNLREANGQPQSRSLDVASASVASQAEEQLLQAYCEAARREARARIAADPDFSPQRYPASQRYYLSPEHSDTQSSRKQRIEKG